MKKILIIMIMLVGVSAGAVTTMTGDTINSSTYDPGDTSGAGYSTDDNKGAGYDPTNTSGAGYDPTNTSGAGYNSGDTSGTGYTSDPNVMLGTGGDVNSSVGAGLKQGEGVDVLYQELKYTPGDSSGVPKLSLEGVVLWLVGIMNQLVYVIIGAALVMFLYGILKLSFVDGQKPEAREQARKFMFWGIVSLFVMVSVWGLVRIFQFTLFGSGNLILPQLK